MVKVSGIALINACKVRRWRAARRQGREIALAACGCAWAAPAAARGGRPRAIAAQEGRPSAEPPDTPPPGKCGVYSKLCVSSPCQVATIACIAFYAYTFGFRTMRAWWAGERHRLVLAVEGREAGERGQSGVRGPPCWPVAACGTTPAGAAATGRLQHVCLGSRVRPLRREVGPNPTPTLSGQTAGRTWPCTGPTSSGGSSTSASPPPGARPCSPRGTFPCRWWRSSSWRSGRVRAAAFSALPCAFWGSVLCFFPNVLCPLPGVRAVREVAASRLHLPSVAPHAPANSRKLAPHGHVRDRPLPHRRPSPARAPAPKPPPPPRPPPPPPPGYSLPGYYAFKSFAEPQPWVVTACMMAFAWGSLINCAAGARGGRGAPRARPLLRAAPGALACPASPRSAHLPG